MNKFTISVLSTIMLSASLSAMAVEDGGVWRLTEEV
jgi:hypothetical protein